MNDQFPEKGLHLCLKDLTNVMRFLNKLCSVEHTKRSTILQGASESALPADFLLFSKAVFQQAGQASTALTFLSNLPHSNMNLVLGWAVLHAVMKMF